MALPLYVSLEQIDHRLIEAAQDLYASNWKAFLRVTVPLSFPGVVAGTLLTFIPAAGDFINAQLLGAPQNHMIGNVIQSKFLELTDYPAAAAMSFILMGAIWSSSLLYARAVGTEQLTGIGGMSAVAVPARARRTSPHVLVFARRTSSRSTRCSFFLYLLLPIGVVIAFSFNEPAGSSTTPGTSSPWTTGGTGTASPGSRARSSSRSRSPCLRA